MTIDVTCALLTCCLLAVLALGIGLTVSGYNSLQESAVVPGFLSRFGTCVGHCMNVYGGHKRDTKTVYCTGVDFVCDVSWQFANITFYSYNKTAFLPDVLGCETLGVGSEVAIELRVATPGNMTAMHEAGYTLSSGTFISGCVILSIGLCILLILAVVGVFLVVDKCKQQKNYSSV